MESNTAIRRANLAAIAAAVGIVAGGPPSMPARTMVLREEDRYTGSANAAYVGRDLADMRAARQEREMRERGMSSVSTRASRFPARS